MDEATTRHGESGALSPGFLAFLIAATIGIFFFLQLGHANVLATESRTAADAAAIAAADHLRLRLDKVGLGSTVADLDRAGACAEAADYAGRNGARLVSCRLASDSLLRPQYAVLVEVEGLDGPMEGPSDSFTEERPRARARAESQLVVASPGNADPYGHAFGHPIVGSKPVLTPWEGSDRWKNAEGWDAFVAEFFGGVPNISGPSAQGFSWPSCGAVTSEFGPRWGRMHQGIDVGIATGTPVGASKEGTVALVRNTHPAGYGMYIDISHGDGITTRYAHLSGFAVSVGDTVERGDLIGNSGNTGSSTGPHLHFEVRAGGAAFNPRHVLSGNPPAC